MSNKSCIRFNTNNLLLHTRDVPTAASLSCLIFLQNNQIVRTWEDNSHVKEALATKIRPKSFIGTVPLDNGFEVPYRLIMPPNLDEDDSETKYPVIFYVYSGPNTNTVQETFTVGKGNI